MKMVCYDFDEIISTRYFLIFLKLLHCLSQILTGGN
jgi:hypothetical protein